MTTIFARVDHARPDKHRGIGVAVVPLHVNVGENTRLALTVLLGAVFFVLLIACSNVANLVLARGTAREREMAVRAALGAGRGRLASQLLTENVLLALVSGGFGSILAAAGVRVLVASGPPDIPRLEQASIDPAVLAFALGISLFAAVLFGLVPAWSVARSDFNE
jgi:ABC-type antimicrobial peptide transport system permease subunit